MNTLFLLKFRKTVSGIHTGRRVAEAGTLNGEMPNQPRILEVMERVMVISWEY